MVIIGYISFLNKGNIMKFQSKINIILLKKNTPFEGECVNL